MAKRKKRKSKRTITPEHLAKMQAGRKHKAMMAQREQIVRDKGLMIDAAESNTSRVLRSMKRQG